MDAIGQWAPLVVIAVVVLILRRRRSQVLAARQEAAAEARTGDSSAAANVSGVSVHLHLGPTFAAELGAAVVQAVDEARERRAAEGRIVQLPRSSVYDQGEGERRA